MIDPGRRRFLRAAPPAQDRTPPRPPWSLRPDDLFTQHCTRCGDCVSACPRQVLRRGDGGFVEIHFATAGCSLCGACVTACTPAALQRAPGAEAFAWRVQVDARCLTRQGVECRLCGDACETHALRFVPTRGSVAQLHIEREACTGCGECLSICPTQALAVR